MKKRKVFKPMTKQQAIEACSDNRETFTLNRHGFLATPIATLPIKPVTARGKRRAERRTQNEKKQL
jgi:hypothetical protein